MSTPLRTRILAFVAAGCLLVLVAYALQDLVPSTPPLPQTSEIASMHAKYYDARQKKFVSFQVSPTHYQPIFDSLLPAVRDRDPAKWEVLGDLDIRLKSGQLFHVSLYVTAETPGAFSAGPNFKKRTYYRGGGSNKLEAALNAAFNEATHTKAAFPPVSPP